METKFKRGDRVKIIRSSRCWLIGCTGTIKGLWDISHTPYRYLVELDDGSAIYPYTALVGEDQIEAEGGTAV